MRKSEVVLTLLLASVFLVAPTLAQPPAETSGRPDAEAYVIGIEDQLRVFVWGEPDLSLTVQVRPDGNITVPLINDIHVVGRPPDQVREEIRERLSHFIREPVVTVIVEEINSCRVYFIGEIQGQGALQFYRPTTLLQGVAAAGGLTEFSKKEITLVREENGRERRYEIDYKRLLAGDPTTPNLVLKAGDTLIFR